MRQTTTTISGGFYGQGSRALRVVARAAHALLFSVPVLAAGAAHGQGLGQAWERAFLAEPALQAARANRQVAVERTAQARAALLPQFEGSYNRQRNRRDYIQLERLVPGLPPPVGAEERYPTRVAQLSLTQGLWRPVNWAALSQANEFERQADFQALATEQDLQARFLVAWFDVMAARDSLLHTEQQAQAARQQVEVARRGVATGTHSDVQFTEAEARHEQALAEGAAAQAEHASKLALLEQLTGPMPGFVPPVLPAGAMPALAGAVEPLDLWLARLTTDNPAVRAAERAVAAAREEVRRQDALHQPTVDLVARRAHNLQGAGTTPGAPGYRSREDSLGVQITVPLYSGGGTTAKVREAQALADKAEHDLEAARRNAVAQAQQAWASARAALARMQAAEHGIRAAQTALRAAVTGQAAGVKAPLDELQARQQLALSQRDLQRARYDRIVGIGRLHAAAGRDLVPLLAEVDALLAPVAQAR